MPSSALVFALRTPYDYCKLYASLAALLFPSISGSVDHIKDFGLWVNPCTSTIGSDFFIRK